MIGMVYPDVQTAMDRHQLLFFFFKDTATTEIYTLSLHDALPICGRRGCKRPADHGSENPAGAIPEIDRKSTRLNSSHSQISYAVFCLKKKTTNCATHCPW